MHSAALKLPPSQISDLMIRACSVSQLFGDPTGCQAQYSGTGGLGPYYAQLFYNMNENTGDMTALCAFQHSGACPTPSVAKIKESDWFSPKKSGSLGSYTNFDESVVWSGVDMFHRDSINETKTDRT